MEIIIIIIITIIIIMFLLILVKFLWVQINKKSNQTMIKRR